jgi:hypothetical protein
VEKFGGRQRHRKETLGVSIPIKQVASLICRFVVAVWALKHGTVLRKTGFLGKVKVHQIFFDVGVSECFVTVDAFEVP